MKFITLSFALIYLLSVRLTSGMQCSFTGAIPNNVNCATFENIQSESTSTAKGVFCRLMIGALCNESNLNRNQNLPSLCSPDFGLINTWSSVGYTIRSLMVARMCQSAIRSAIYSQG